MEGATLVVTHALGGGIGAWIAGRIFGCRLNVFVAFAIATAAGIVYLIPTVGFAVSLVVMVALIRQFSEGDWMEAIFTTLIARGVVLAAALLWQGSAA